MQPDTAVPGKVEDKAKGVTVEEADADGVVDAVPIIPAEPAPVAEEAAEPARLAITRMAFTPRLWTTAIAPH